MTEEDFLVCRSWGEQHLKSVKARCTDCGKEVAISEGVKRELPAHVKPLCMDCALPGLDGQAEATLADGALEEIAAYSAYRRLRGL